jgi:hypothetical protein
VTRDLPSAARVGPLLRSTFMDRCRQIERVADRLFEGEEAVLHVMGWVGRPRRGGRFVESSVCLTRGVAVLR